ncbi:hypothetical protein O6H91_14G046900 [Diphasiastrum complanatum]|uniref:Uncharacterized protein n=1 Tax=Diphasiastrum complanatum TaxID=34168 RepID=A0ACC2BP27_DIPCM|nr:hypothetical protein O6H91_14G046900 [Diphasiastrum complanatum]
MSGKWDEASWSCGGAGAAKKFYRSASAATAEDVSAEPLDAVPVIEKPKKSKRLKPDKWRAAFDRDGKLVGLEKVLKSILSGGIDHSIRGEVWEFLLGCYVPGTTTEYRQQLREARRERYKELIELCQRMHASIGSGSLAYTVGSKVMDVRIMSKDSAKKEAKLWTETVNSVAKTHLENLHEEKAEQVTEFSRFQDVSTDKSVEGSVGYFQEFSSTPDSNDTAETTMQDSAMAAGEREVPSAQVMTNSSSSNLNSQESRDHISGLAANAVVNLGVEGSKIMSDTEKSGHNTDQDKHHDSVANKPTLGQQLIAEASALKGAVTANYVSSKDVNANEERIAEWLWTLHRIVVDVVRTDRHLKFYDDAKNMARMSDILAVYAWIDPATGYCQGMSDLLSPFIVIFEEDADAFWCFESLLRRVRHNFQMEGPVGVMKQLTALTKILELTDLHMSKHLVLIGADSFLFAFRMLLVLFRRELSFGEALCMWEMMWAADFDEGMPWALEYNCLESLIITPPNTFQEQYVFEDNFNTEYGQRQKSPSASPQDQPSHVSPPEDDLADHLSRSPFCGLRAGNFWSKYNRPKVRTVSSLLGRTGDDELSVFVVAAILILNRAKFFKEAQSMDDAIKMFNDIQMKIRVKHCIRTAIKLRKKYRRQLLKRAALERRSVSLQLLSRHTG